MSNPNQQKCVSLPGSLLNPPPQENGYGDYGNNQYCSDAGAHWVRIWINWWDVDQNPPNYDTTDLAQQWNFYTNDPTPRTIFDRLDSWVRDANDRGIWVLLSIGHYYPIWANGASGPEPGTNKDQRSRFPSNIDVGSPWERFVSYCYNRYRYNVWTPGVPVGIYNPAPSASNPWGNPRSGWIGALSVVNEPNEMQWQDYSPSCTAAKMMTTMDTAIAYWGVGATLFGPDLSDRGTTYGPKGNDPSGVVWSTDYLTTATEILNNLGNWSPQVPWRWSHHVYNDIKAGNNARAENVRNLLWSKNWRGDPARWVYITEGGWSMYPSFANAGTQNTKMQTWWNLSRSNDYRLATQHAIRCGASPNTGMVDSTGTALPLYANFKTFQPRR